MKIRTHLFLILLPIIVLSNLIITSLLSHKWYQEVSQSFQTQIKNSSFYLADFLHHTPSYKTPLILTPEDLPSQAEYLKEQKISHIYILTPSQMQSSLGSHHPFSKQGSSLAYERVSSPFFEGGKKKMSAMTPLSIHRGHIESVLVVDAFFDEISQKLHKNLFLIFISVSTTLILFSFLIYLFERRIAKPIQKLNSSALTIAAGQYGEKIQLQGPKEISELANTLNIMSECLLEHINRMKEKSLQRERWYGEYESALLLQHLMLEKTIESCQSDAIAMKALSFYSETPKGLLLDIPSHDSHLKIQLTEARQAGFKGMYDLLTQHKVFSHLESLKKDFRHIELHISLTNKSVIFSSYQFPPPLVWCAKDKRWISSEESYILEAGDYFFLTTPSFSTLKKDIPDLLEKVLKYFSDEGFETVSLMLQKKIQFWVKKEDPEQDIHLLCFQWL